MYDEGMENVSLTKRGVFHVLDILYRAVRRNE